MATTRHAVRVSHMDSKAGNEPDWMEEYKAVLSPTPTAAKKAEGPGCCPICCTGFSIFGALFLFVIAAAMKSDYPYMHIDGAAPARGVARRGVTWGGAARHEVAASSPVLPPRIASPTALSTRTRTLTTRRGGDVTWPLPVGATGFGDTGVPRCDACCWRRC